MVKIDEVESEFGKGLTYCLGMFLAHAERITYFGSKIMDDGGESMKQRTINSWFNGASDHLFELVIPETLPKDLQDRLKSFQKKCCENSMWDVTEKDIDMALSEAKEFLREIDDVFGIETIEATWK